METKLDNDKSPFCWTLHSPRAPRRTAHGAAPPARGPSPACAPHRPHAPSSAAGSSPRSRSRGPGGPATAGWRLEERGGGERHGQAPARCPGQACELPTGSLCPHGHAPARAHRLASAVRAASGHLKSPLRVGRTEGGGQPLDRAGGGGTGVTGTGKRGRPQASVQRAGPAGSVGRWGSSSSSSQEVAARAVASRREPARCPVLRPESGTVILRARLRTRAALLPSPAVPGCRRPHRARARPRPALGPPSCTEEAQHPGGCPVRWLRPPRLAR